MYQPRSTKSLSLLFFLFAKYLSVIFFLLNKNLKFIIRSFNLCFSWWNAWMNQWKSVPSGKVLQFFVEERATTSSSNCLKKRMDKVGLEFFILVAVYLSLSFLQSNLGIIEFNFSICTIFQNVNFFFFVFFVFFTKHFFSNK